MWLGEGGGSGREREEEEGENGTKRERDTKERYLISNGCLLPDASLTLEI